MTYRPPLPLSETLWKLDNIWVGLGCTQNLHSLFSKQLKVQITTARFPLDHLRDAACRRQREALLPPPYLSLLLPLLPPLLLCQLHRDPPPSLRSGSYSSSPLVGVSRTLGHIGQHLRRCHDMSPPNTRFWKWANGVKRVERDLFWCISRTNNVKSYKKINGNFLTMEPRTLII